MELTMRDADFSFQAAAEQRNRRKLEPPPRSTRKPGEPGWKVNGADEPDKPRWKVERDAKTGIAVFTELIQPAAGTGGLADRRHTRSIFTFEITEPCVVASQHANVGDRVICFHQSASDLLAGGRAQIIEENRNAF